MADRRRSSTRTRNPARRDRPTRERVAPRRAGARARRAPRGAPVAARRVAGGAPRTPGAARRSASARVTRRRRVLFGLLGALALVALLFTFVYPTRTYLAQREQIRRAENRLEVLRQQTATLERDTERLRGDGEVERIAREQYGLVRPGETPYVIVPDATPTTPTTTAPTPSP